MSDTNSNNSQTQSIADYLAQLLKDRNKVNAFPNVFIHVERLIDEEITRVRSSLFQVNGVKKEPLVLPDPAGEAITLTEKVFVPVKDHPEFNFVGRILGPRGMTAKQLELETGCKIMVRGKGSMRDKKKEEQNRGKPNWEHLNEELHVLISVEDTENRAKIKMQRAIEEVKKLIIPADGEDELKKRQLMELAIINGTYRDSESMRALAAAGEKREGEIYKCGPDDFPGLGRTWTPRPVSVNRSYAACLQSMTNNFGNEDQKDETSSDSSSEISSDDEESQNQSVRSESVCSSRSTFSLRPTAPCFVPSAKLNPTENESDAQNLTVDDPPPLKKISRRQRRKLANLKKNSLETEMLEDDQESEPPYTEIESPPNESYAWRTVGIERELSSKASKSSKDEITWQLVQFENNQIHPKESKSSRDKITWQIVQIERDTLNFSESADSVSMTVGGMKADDPDSQFFYSLIPHFKSLNVMSKMRCGIEIQVAVLKYLCNEKTILY